MATPQTFQINWLAAAGSALGAVSSAVLLSTLGAAGTLLGAALGSLVITVGGSIYTQSLQRTRDRVVLARVGRREDTVPGGATTAVAHDSAPEPLPLATEDTTEPRPGLPWKRILGLTVGLFLAAMALILLFEVSAGRPVSSFTGGSSNTDTGTTFSDLRSGGGTSGDAEAPDAEATPSQQPTKETTPTGQATVQPTAKEEPTLEEQPPPQEQPTQAEQAEPAPPEEAAPDQPGESDE